MDRGISPQDHTMAKTCVRKRRVRSSVTGKTVLRCAKFSGGAKRKSRKSRKSRK